jgi:calcineurin-like phosphoesterase family protein
MAGTKILVVGNHDRPPSAMAALGFALVLREGVLNIGGRTCRVNHFPYASHSQSFGEDKFKELRPRKVPGEILLHGHTHSKSRVNGNQINLGVDAWDYGPASYGQVDALVRGI